VLALALAPAAAIAQQPAAAAKPALVISCEDPTFARDSNHERLVAAFGKDNVTARVEPGPKGMPPNVTSLLFAKDPKRRLDVMWHDMAARAKPFAFIFERPSQWIAPKGKRAGSTLLELERANGAPFKLNGFGGELDGMVYFQGELDKLPGGCSLGGTLEPTVKLPKRQMDKIAGDDEFDSTNPIMRQAKPKAYQVQGVYQP